MPRLRRSSCAAPGISRRRRGRGFEYLDSEGERIDDPEVLERIAALAIPPAWREVWVCMDPRGHLQATGVDVAGRKQYLYHEHWRAHRDRLKFDAMLQFGRALPLLRRRVGCDLRAPSDKSDRLRVDQLTPARVFACAVRLLDVGFFRVGSEDYAERNSSYGLTTMLREHVTVAAGELVFDFPAKSGQRRVQEIDDRDALGVVAALKRRRGGEQLLAYRAGRGWADCSAGEVNTYIAEHAGGPFTAKDFRTWHATALAAVALAAPARHTGAKATRTRRDRGGGRDQEGSGLPGQHAGGVSRLLRRPARDRPLPCWRDDRARARAPYRRPQRRRARALQPARAPARRDGGPGPARRWLTASLNRSSRCTPRD